MDSTQKDNFSLTLLGTGSMTPRADRVGSSTLVQAGNQNLLFDVGRGTFHRMWQAKLSRSDIDAVFLTHLHSDHIVGLPDVYLSGGTLDTVVKGLSGQPFIIYGPEGTRSLMNGIKEAFRPDTAIRESEQKQPFVTSEVQAHEIVSGVIYERDGVKVSAFPVAHGAIKPAFGYRVDYDGRSLIISGDTNFRSDEPLLQAAVGVDVIVHEVLILGSNFKKIHPGAARSIGEKHSFPDEVGRVFSETKPKLGVYTHIEWVYDASDVETNVVNDIIKETRQSYNGPLLVGNDLDKIVIGKDKVEVVKPTYSLLPLATP